MPDSPQLLNPWLLEKLQSGECILFLGAGAAYGSKGLKGEKPVNGLQLRDLISDRFLGGRHKDKPLPRVAEFAKYESSLPDVQTYIRDLFHPLNPAPFHKLIPTFRWHAIVTTNYDLIIERAYDEVGERQQQLRPIIRDGDNFASVLKDQNALPYLKLHGCINTINDENLPLILGSEEYAKHQRNRKRLFSHFADWARERPVIFVGYDISDANIQQILFDLTDIGVQRPAYAVVDPGLDDIACRYWTAHRFVPAATTMENFLQSVDLAIPRNNRILASLRSVSEVSISKWFSSSLPPSNNLVRYLDEELSHVHASMVTEGDDPKAFYSGRSYGWSALSQGFDFKRRTSDDLILECVLAKSKSKAPSVILVKGHAGSGKSVMLKRFAWDAAVDFDAQVLFLKEGGVLRTTLLIEIAELTQDPIILIVDDAIKHLPDIARLYKDAENKKLAINIVMAARTNEWNLGGTDNDFPISEEHELKELTEREINSLLDKLAHYNTLGELAKLPRASQAEHFKLHAERQLMVALHEATTGKPFEELAYDEFEHVQPAEAKVLYLDICTLHRLGISVRAGLVSRVSGVTFELFSQDFFKPLEHVVHSYFDSASRDYVYRSRHPLIAEFVFRQALPDPVERAAQITRIIRHMDIDYESDSIAFSQLIRGRILSELFADKALVKQIFDAALESGAPPEYINHQNAIFELHHPGGSMRAALRAITEAESLSSGRDRSIEHTKAMVLRRLALESDHPLEREKYRADAKLILKRQQSSARQSHAFDTFGRVLLDELRDRIAATDNDELPSSDLTNRSFADAIRQIEECISVGLQKFPGDEHLLALDSDLARLLQDAPRTLLSLEAASRANPGRPFIAVRLAKTYNKLGRRTEALEKVRACLQSNPSSKECHLELALLLMEESEFQNRADIQYHLKRSFTEGDTNFDAQFWYARHEVVHGDKELGLTLFKHLSNSRTEPVYKKNLRGPLLAQDGTAAIFSGYVKSMGPNYCFATSAELRFDVFLGAHQFSSSDWEKLRENTKIKFAVSFSLRGPAGVRGAITL